MKAAALKLEQQIILADCQVLAAILNFINQVKNSQKLNYFCKYLLFPALSIQNQPMLICWFFSWNQLENEMEKHLLFHRIWNSKFLFFWWPKICVVEMQTWNFECIWIIIIHKRIQICLYVFRCIPDERIMYCIHLENALRCFILQFG